MSTERASHGLHRMMGAMHPTQTNMDPSENSASRSEPVLEELSQAKARFGVCLFALVYLGAWALFSGSVNSRVVLVVGGYAVFSAIWFVMVKKLMKKRPGHVAGHVAWRRWVVIFTDLGINTFFMYTLEARGAFFYPMYLWIIVGNGVRFGSRYLLLAMAVGVTYFAPMIVFSEYWRTNWVAGTGLLAGLIVLPGFYLSLIKRLHEANQRLEFEVERARVAGYAKTEFLANMSHEIRTPMSGVLGVLQLMRRTSLDATQKEYLDLIQRSAGSLLRILDDILDFARIEAGRVTLEHAPLNLRLVVEDVVQLLRPRAEEKGLVLEAQLSDGVDQIFFGDAMRVRQILFNLVGNAVKFTEEGQVEIEAEQELGADGRSQIIFRVTDTGPGIPQDKLEEIFEKFERAETRLGHQVGGSGLGLAISRQLARLMGGDVVVNSQMGAGTTFLATFLLDSPKSVPPLVEKTVDSYERDFALKALVVEDSQVNQLVTCSLLRQLGISSTVAADGKVAFERWREGEFDLIMMDVRLPELDGLEVTRRIRAREGEGDHIPILAVTANVSRDDEVACLQAGMDFFLPKPVRLEQLVEALQALREEDLFPSDE